MCKGPHLVDGGILQRKGNLLLLIILVHCPPNTEVESRSISIFTTSLIVGRLEGAPIIQTMAMLRTFIISSDA